MSDLVKFLRARLDEDEMWARAANRAYEYADPPAVPPDTGVHWQWVTGENWDAVTVDPAAEFVAEPGYSCNLVTVEEWPAGRSTMPRPYAESIVEMDSAAAGHIVRWDPARALAEVAAKRAILAEFERVCADYVEQCAVPGGPGPYTDMGYAWLSLVVSVLAVPHADHPDYLAEWAVAEA